jgi:hypothetical protein
MGKRLISKNKPRGSKTSSAIFQGAGMDGAFFAFFFRFVSKPAFSFLLAMAINR